MSEVNKKQGLDLPIIVKIDKNNTVTATFGVTKMNSDNSHLGYVSFSNTYYDKINGLDDLKKSTK